ncbi:MAG: M1 family metallopeptidase [Sphingomonadaceae bacterium]
MSRSVISGAILALAAGTLASMPAASAGAGTIQAQTQLSVGSSSDASSAATPTQLPRTAIPSHYALSLVPDAAHLSFEASVTIALELRQPTNMITLNAADLNFAGAMISAGPGQPPQAASRIDVDAAAQTASIHFLHPLAAGQYQLKIDYSGSIGTQANGLFALDYQSNGVDQRALYTQFENSDARRLLPCWDEPAYKATFALELTLPAGQMGVSNMPLATSIALADGRQRLRFATTPKMSTYLLFVAAGEFERATVTEGNTELGVVTQRGALAQARFALDASRAVLREFNDYFGLPYPLPKLDNVAAPGRNPFFSAMENWGAIFTFENALLLDPASATQSDREQIFLTAAHEIAHQWFGDLVTMRWWDDLWLNEGFASSMETLTATRLHPEWRVELSTVGNREAAMELDALATTHPVVQAIATVEQANQAFDSITYQKGEAVIRMLEQHVGADAWRAGVRAYISRHAYGSSVSDDLWRAIEQTTGQPVLGIARDFTLQPGVPLLKVGEPVCKDGRTSVTLTQAEFSKDQPNRKPLTWRVPVQAQTVGGARVAALVSAGRASLTLPGCGPVLLNAGQSGYYRTQYGPRELAALAASFERLDAIDQLGLLADSWALGQAGRQPLAGFLDLADQVPASAAPQVWGKLATVYRELHRAYQGKPQQQLRFDRYVQARLAPQLARLGWQAGSDDSGPQANLRAELIGALSSVNASAVITEARRYFATLFKAAERGDDELAPALPAALRRVVLSVVAEQATPAHWEQLHALAKGEASAMQKSDLYELLGAANDPTLARRALTLALSGEPGATDSAAIIARVAARHPELAFQFALEHRSELEPLVDAASWSRYFAQLAAASADPATITALQAYSYKFLEPEARGDVLAAIATIRYRIAARQRSLPELDSWLTKKEPAAP